MKTTNPAKIVGTNPTHIVDRIVKHISNARKVVNGNHVLIIYYVIIILFLIFDFYIRRHVEKVISENKSSKEDLKNLNRRLFNFYEMYQKHGFIFINIILYIIVFILTVIEEGFDVEYLLTISLSFIIYTVLMKIVMKFFVNETSYKNKMFARAIHIICYIILGNYFTFFMPFIKPPSLLLAYAGLFIGLLFCIYIMTQAIFNPEILRRGNADEKEYGDAYAILKGMIGVVVCILALEYMMVYSCFVINHDFYISGSGKPLNGIDMFYYLIVSFSTIGYGDIYPTTVGNLYYSQITAIIIGLSSMFTSGCFISAVISTANTIAENHQQQQQSSQSSQAAVQPPEQTNPTAQPADQASVKKE